MSDSAERTSSGRPGDAGLSPAMVPRSPAAVSDDANPPTAGSGEPAEQPAVAPKKHHDLVVGLGRNKDQPIQGGLRARALQAGADSQLQLNQYREQLARDYGRRETSARALASSPTDKSRVSPIQEEIAGSPVQPFHH